jgi:hypothetical protein
LSALTRRLFAEDEFAMMREAYLMAVDKLKLAEDLSAARSP